MESLPEPSNQKEELQHYLTALNLVEQRYRSGQARLEDLLFAIDQVQREFYKNFRPDGPDYSDLYKASITHEQAHYTEFVSGPGKIPSPVETRMTRLNDLVSKIGQSLNRETIAQAIKTTADPDLTDEDFNSLIGTLTSQAISNLNSGSFLQAGQLDEKG